MVVLFLPFTYAADQYDFNNLQEEKLFRELTAELRCPKCQNQNLADSNSPISIDLRRQIHRLLEDGKNDEEIKDYLVARYSKFVLYRPVLDRSTWFLWFAPIILIFCACSAAAIMQRKYKVARDDLENEDLPISNQENEKLNRLLSGKDQSF